LVGVYNCYLFKTTKVARYWIWLEKHELRGLKRITQIFGFLFWVLGFGIWGLGFGVCLKTRITRIGKWKEESGEWWSGEYFWIIVYGLEKKYVFHGLEFGICI